MLHSFNIILYVAGIVIYVVSRNRTEMSTLAMLHNTIISIPLVTTLRVGHYTNTAYSIV